MITVPQAYSESMDKTGRNRTYVRVAIGIVNVDAQAAAKYTSNDSARLTSFAGLENSEKVSRDYATFELDRWSVDGKQYIAPANAPYFFQGFLSGSVSNESKVLEAPPVFVATLGGAYNIFGLTLTFDTFNNAYPVDFDVVGYYEDVEIIRHEIRGNSSAKFEQVLPLDGVDVIQLEFLTTNKPFQRVRLREIILGIGKTFTNNELISTSLDATIHPISLELPVSEFSFEVDNTSGEYDLEDSSNIMFFLQSRQPVTVAYGYDIHNDGNIHWIPGGTHLLKARPEIGETSVVFEAGSSLLFLQNTYYRGLHRPEKISLHALATEVFNDAIGMLPPGVDLKWYIDPTLQNVFTSMPLPVVTHAECLQLIAHAGRANLSIDRDGRVSMTTAFVPDATISDNNHMPYGSAEGLLNRVATGLEYATFEQNFWTVDGTSYLYSDEGPFQDTGYTSLSQSDALGALSPNPEISITLDGTFSLMGLTLVFGDVAPSNFKVQSYSGNVLKDTWIVSGNTSKTYILSETISAFDSLKITFTKMSKPFTRLRIKRIVFGAETDYTLWRRNTTGSPSSTVLPLISTLSIGVNRLVESTEVTELFSEEITLEGQRNLQITFSDAARDVVATLAGAGQIISQEHFTYSSNILVEGTGTFTLQITGRLLNSSTTMIHRGLNTTGEPETIENPLIDSAELAQDVLDWVSEYIQKRKIHEVPYRGDPTLDVGDLIFYQTRSGKTPLARITELKLSAGQGLSGSLVLKEVEGFGQLDNP